MASTRFIATIGDDELSALVWEKVKGEGDELQEATLHRGDKANRGVPYDISFEYKTRLDGEDEDSWLTDTYEVDDYSIDPFDWGGSDAITRIQHGWRKELYGRFGQEYAEWFLFGELEETMENSAGGSWLLED